MVALLNDVRFSQGKSAMGFLNPLLYSKGPANGFFDDITTGNNADGHLLGEGWEATTGWDPCSGLGNPSLDKMIAYVANEK
jgi:tripeptidyl-peptidase-1